MPVKRPISRIAIQVPPESKAVSITDTMTLVVEGVNGVVRVKEDGIAQVAQYTPQEPATSEGESGKLRFEDLTLGRELGKGSQGRVRIVQHNETRKKYALKYISFDAESEDMRQGLEAELRQVVAVKHQNVVSSHEAFFRNGRLYIVLDYMNCGTMKDVMNRHERMDEEMLAYIARELFKGLMFLHGLNIIHRDIKPANVLANSKGEVKISDFGVAKVLSGGNLQTLSSQGSVPYMSPERINSRPYSLNSDIWSAGLVIAECALGKYPFASEKSNMYEICQIITSDNVKVMWDKYDHTFTKELMEFVDWCLSPVETRPGAAQLLQHPFIKKADSVEPSVAGEWFSCKPSENKK